MITEEILRSGLDSESQFCWGERTEDFVQLQNEYFDRFRPSTPEERYHVDSMIRNEWMLRRMFRAEAHLWEWATLGSDRSTGCPLGQGFAKLSPEFMRLQRRVAACERSYEKAYAELQRLQSVRALSSVADAAPAPQITAGEPAPKAKLASFPNITASGAKSAPALRVSPPPEPPSVYKMSTATTS